MTTSHATSRLAAPRATQNASRSVASPILVTGGTGTLGKIVVARLRELGYGVRVLSRHARAAVEGLESVGGDLATGAGVAAAMNGVEVIVHCAGSSKGDEDKALHLVRAASRAGARHLVYISVVGANRVPMASGIDRAMFGYFGSKYAAERVVAESGVPWTTLRATQFHDLVFTVAQGLAKLPLVPVPTGFRFQPIDTDDVAARLVELALGDPAGLVPDVAGPRIYTMADLLKSYLRAVGVRRVLIPLPLPGKAARAVRAGAVLAPDRAVGRGTWEDYLGARLAAERARQ
jgi:uncharacterized protein YbjT (DUF2867 family)